MPTKRTALVKSGPKKGKLKKGFRFAKGGRVVKAKKTRGKR